MVRVKDTVRASLRIREKVNKREAIFRPPRMEKKSMQTLFSVYADGNLCADCRLSSDYDQSAGGTAQYTQRFSYISNTVGQVRRRLLRFSSSE